MFKLILYLHVDVRTDLKSRQINEFRPNASPVGTVLRYMQ